MYEIQINAAPKEVVQDSELNFDAVDEHLLSPNSLLSPESAQGSKGHFQDLENLLNNLQTPKKQAADTIENDLKSSQKDLAHQVCI